MRGRTDFVNSFLVGFLDADTVRSNDSMLTLSKISSLMEMQIGDEWHWVASKKWEKSCQSHDQHVSVRLHQVWNHIWNSNIEQRVHHQPNPQRVYFKGGAGLIHVNGV